jgi:SAM-dependent methyltransferase
MNATPSSSRAPLSAPNSDAPSLARHSESLNGASSSPSALAASEALPLRPDLEAALREVASVDQAPAGRLFWLKKSLTALCRPFLGRQAAFNDRAISALREQGDQLRASLERAGRAEQWLRDETSRREQLERWLNAEVQSRETLSKSLEECHAWENFRRVHELAVAQGALEAARTALEKRVGDLDKRQQELETRQREQEAWREGFLAHAAASSHKLAFPGDQSAQAPSQPENPNVEIRVRKKRADHPAYAPVLNFGPHVESVSIEAPINQEAFERFERDFDRFVEARDTLYPLIPGPEEWPSFRPTREKILEYYLTLECLQLQPSSVYVDIASCMSLFPNYLAEVIGAEVIRQDLLYKPGKQVVEFPRALAQEGRVSIACLGSNACELPLPDASADALALHCSFEHFEGDSDRLFVREALRVLKPGGKLLIIPFYCGDTYMEQFQKLQVPGSQFHRYYDPGTFVERVLEGIEVPFSLETRYYRNVRAIDKEFYCDYSLCIHKKSSSSR